MSTKIQTLNTVKLFRPKNAQTIKKSTFNFLSKTGKNITVKSSQFFEPTTQNIKKISAKFT